MKQKWTVLMLAGVTALALTGCSGSKSGDGSANPAPAASGQQAPADPELQQLMQAQRQDTQEIDRLVGLIDQDLGLEVPAPAGQQGNGQGRRGGAGQGGAQGSGQNQDQLKQLLTQEEQPRKDLIIKLTAFEALTKQAADAKNEKALADAKDQFTALEELLPGRGFRRGGAPAGGQGNGQAGSPNGGAGQGMQARQNTYQEVGTKLDAAIAQLKTDLGAKS